MAATESPPSEAQSYSDPNKESDTDTSRTDISPSSLEKDGNAKPQGREIRGIKWVLVCLALYISLLLYGLDTTIAADVQASVVDTFGNVQQITWLGSGFPLGSVAVVLLVGSLYSHFNQKWIYLGSVVLFEAGSALCGAAPTMTALIVGRVLAGMGGSGVYLGVLNYFVNKTTPEERGAYVAGIGLIWGFGCILGPIIGGAFSISAATWRWAFYINLPIAGVFTPVYLFCLPDIKLAPAAETWKGKLLSVDWLGFLLSAAVWVSFTLVLTFAGTTWEWNDGRTIALFIVFGALLALFIGQQVFKILTNENDRLLPLHLIKSRTQVLLYIGTSAAITAVFVPIYFLPLHFQFVSNDSALLAAVRLLPFIIFFVVSNMISGYMLPRLPWYSILYITSGVLLCISGGLFYSVTAETSKAKVYGYSILGAVGAGMTCQTGYSIATVTVPGGAAEAVNAISLQNVSQIGSTVIALVLSGQIFQSVAIRKLNVALAGLGFSEQEIRSAVAGTQSTLFEKLKGDTLTNAIHAITEAMSDVFALLIAAGAMVLLAGVLMKREKMLQ